MQRNSYISWMSRPLSAAVCPTPHIWPEDNAQSAVSRESAARATGRAGDPSVRKAAVTMSRRALGGRRATRTVKAPTGTYVLARVEGSDRTPPHFADTGGRPFASKEDFMNEEKLRILKMLEQGKVSAEEASRLMEALDRTDARPTENEIKRKWLHIRVAKDGRDTVNMRVPLALLKFGFKLAPHAVRRHGERARQRAERARERAHRMRDKAHRAREKARRDAERTREKMRKKLKKDLDGMPVADIDEIVDRAFEETVAEAEESLADAEEAIRESVEEAEEAFGESLENGLEGLRNLDLDLDKILEMAHSEGFNGKILDVYDDDDDERVTITLE